MIDQLENKNQWYKFGSHTKPKSDAECRKVAFEVLENASLWTEKLVLLIWKFGPIALFFPHTKSVFHSTAINCLSSLTLLYFIFCLSYFCNWYLVSYTFLEYIVCIFNPHRISAALFWHYWKCIIGKATLSLVSPFLYFISQCRAVQVEYKHYTAL